MQIIRWDDYTIPTEILDKDDNPVNLTDCSVYFTVKKERDLRVGDDSKAVIKKTITSFSNPIAWTFDLVLTNQDTDLDIWDYWYDLQIEFPWNIIKSITKDVFSVVQDVTRDPQLPTT